MIDRSWKWFKTGHQFDIYAKAISAVGKPSTTAIVIFTETKDKQDTRREAIKELAKYGYQNIEVYKIVYRGLA